MNQPTKPSHRIAVRDEGGTVAYYLASMDTMEGAEELMRVNHLVLELVPESRERYLEVMEEFLTNASEMLTGKKPTRMERREAPPHEQGGHG